MFFSKKLRKNLKISHCFFSNKNGVSKGIYKSLNCGFGSKDKRFNVRKNLNIVCKKIGCKYKNLILMNQVHGNKVVYFSKNYKNRNKPICDAILTNKKEIALGILTADCVPILIYDPNKNIVGAIHAGWKGAFKKIITNTIKKLVKLGSKRKDLIACVGPCISQNNYEVGLNFYKKFLKQKKSNKIYFKRHKFHKLKFDLRKYVVSQIKINGVNKIDHIWKNTFKNSNNFFSYRRTLFKKQKDYGRNLSVIMINR